MGNFASCKRRKKKPEEAAEPKDTASDSRTEDVLYASINHSNINPERPIPNLEDNDCDYAVVKLPQETTHKHKSTEDCSDDYVLMG
ncbi:uncharacterized protein si:ch211-214p13.7 isoform X1 [Danio rerio]|uniref:Uncharacterized protein si:ch211-214p13.7 isoform X1 n=1 Tax=Danio rerio TaxID=7955 RepID=A0A8N7UVG2_DANRE|nr:uncharacterized protein si:ch211-214p13.7 [Danio rerio]|eukprot:XP_706329.1 uncharacterized protein si:ch211-214p13.7 [Danio rerio]